jgi:hypothetical protein
LRTQISILSHKIRIETLLQVELGYESGPIKTT